MKNEEMQRAQQAEEMMEEMMEEMKEEKIEAEAMEETKETEHAGARAEAAQGEGTQEKPEAEHAPEDAPEDAPDDLFDDVFEGSFESGCAARPYGRMYTLSGPAARRRRGRMPRGKKRLLFAGAAIAVPALLAWALSWLSSSYVIVKAYDETEAEYALFLMEESGDALAYMTEELMMYLELTHDPARALPAWERSQMVGQMHYGSRRVAENGARARTSLARMARSGDVLRGTKQGIDLRDAHALLGMMEHGAQQLSAYVRMAANMMVHEELWPQHGAEVIVCLQEMAAALDELSLCMQAVVYRRFVSDEDMLLGGWNGDIHALMVNSSEDEIRERGMQALIALSGVQSRLEAYEALAEAAQTKAMENIG